MERTREPTTDRTPDTPAATTTTRATDPGDAGGPDVEDPATRPPAGASGTDPQRWAQRWVWALPAWGGLLAVSTITHQPDARSDFPAYAAYVGTGGFRASHLVASIGGAAAGVLGATALALVLAGRGEARRALRALVAFVVGQVLVTSVFGVAAFAQPAIGALHDEGAHESARRVDELVYGAPLFGTVALGLVALVAGSVALGRAVSRSGLVPRWVGRMLGGGMVVFAVSGPPGLVLQPLSGLAVAGAAVAIALAARSTDPAGAGRPAT